LQKRGEKEEVHRPARLKRKKKPGGGGRSALLGTEVAGRRGKLTWEIKGKLYKGEEYTKN